MDSSVDRRRSIEQHLRETYLPFRRVKGLNTFRDIYFPHDIISNWNKMEAQIDTSEVLPSKFAASRNHSLANYTHVISGLIGRSKKNKVKELGCTSSHLEAMRQVSSHWFALISLLFVSFKGNLFQSDSKSLRTYNGRWYSNSIQHWFRPIGTAF